MKRLLILKITKVQTQLQSRKKTHEKLFRSEKEQLVI